MNSSNKQNRATLEKRLSMKKNISVSGRLTSRPSISLYRQSLPTTHEISQFSNIGKELKECRPSFTSNITVQMGKSIKKQSILTNLARKLQHQSQLKEIIHSKIKNQAKQWDQTKGKIDFQRSNHSQNNENLFNKLSSCQQEIRKYKDLINSLMNKINALQKKQRINGSRVANKVDIGIQVDLDQPRPFHDNSIFLQNLHKTLKVLSGNAHN